MLVELRIENHRSIRDEQVLTMEAGRVGDGDDLRPREVKGWAKPLLPAAALYGANASGKSNVLAALAFMRDAITDSHRLWAPGWGVPRDPFAWGPKVKEPSLFEATVLVAGVQYQYGFVADDEQFLEEWLYAWPKGRKQTWLERERSGEADVFRFGEALQGENRLVQQVTRPNALFLSAAVQHRHEQLLPLYAWFADIATVNVPEPRRSAESFADWWARLSIDPTHNLHRELRPSLRQGPDPDLAGLRGLLRAADVGIMDIKLSSEEEAPLLGVAGYLSRRVLLQHRSGTGEAWLPLEEESEGTRTLYRLGPILLDTLRVGGLLVVDELAAGLHPLLAIHIVRQFNDQRTNPKNAQLLFTTHDTHLLGTVAGDTSLRRDQVWLTEKDHDGATVLYPLTDYSPRKAENVERGYLQGRYGAIPFLGDLAPVEE